MADEPAIKRSVTDSHSNLNVLSNDEHGLSKHKKVGHPLDDVETYSLA